MTDASFIGADRDRVSDCLKRASRPLTRDELSTHTHLTRNAVDEALSFLCWADGARRLTPAITPIDEDGEATFVYEPGLDEWLDIHDIMETYEGAALGRRLVWWEQLDGMFRTAYGGDSPDTVERTLDIGLFDDPDWVHERNLSAWRHVRHRIGRFRIARTIRTTADEMSEGDSAPSVALAGDSEHA
jgi:hypothetical protein